MAKTVTITLLEPIVGHDGAVREIVMRPPNLMEFARIGEPLTAMAGADGNAIVVDNDVAITAYLERCIVEPKDKLLLDQVQLADAFRIKEAFLDFFGEARQAAKSVTSPTP